MRYHQQLKYSFIFIVILIIAGLLLSGCGAEKSKVYRVGILSGLYIIDPAIDGFKNKMTELGYVEGENITYDIQKTEFDISAYQRVAQKFVDDKVDLIFVYPTEATQEVKKATEGTNIPVVFTFVAIEDAGLVNSVREPGGNISGVRFPITDIALKQFDIMRQLTPDAKRVWLPYTKDYPLVPPILKILRPAAEEAGITFIEFPAADAAALQTELDARAASGDPGMDAILIISGPLLVLPDAYTVVGKFAYEHHIPIASGGLLTGDYPTMSQVTADFARSGELAAPLADKILSDGISAGTIPVVSPELFISINTKAAEFFGITVPENLIKLADEKIR